MLEHELRVCSLRPHIALHILLGACFRRIMGNTGSLRILLVDDEAVILETLGDYLGSKGHLVRTASRGEEALAAVEAGEYDLVLLDVRMPGMDGIECLRRIQQCSPTLPVILITGHGSMETVVEALRAGASDFLAKPIRLAELGAAIERARNVGRLLRDQARLRRVIGRLQPRSQELVGQSSAMKAVRAQIAQIASAGADTVLLTGETGTGKELVALAIHRACGHEGDPFIAVSCPSVVEQLFESEFFGHARGAFTGADRERPGYFELAEGGTLFLDEIADIPVDAQASLLRALETRTLRRVGSSREVKVNVRVIAATNSPLADLVEQGRFRRDLFYRINLFSVDIPPLRERREDILPLARHFLALIRSERELACAEFSREAEQTLQGHDYPGNVRELRSIVERAALLCGSRIARRQDLAIPVARPAAAPALPEGGRLKGERDRILSALEESRWNRRQAARILSIPYSTLRYRLRSLRID